MWNTYVQCLRGFNGWHLEWRLTGETPDTYIHLRTSCHGGSAKRSELKKSDWVSDGEHRDLLNVENVVDAFRAFHRAELPPPCVKWRELGV